MKRIFYCLGVIGVVIVVITVKAYDAQIILFSKAMLQTMLGAILIVGGGLGFYLTKEKEEGRDG